MTDTELKKILEDLFQEWSNEKMSSFNPIASAGSNRKYYRLSGKSKTAIGAFNEDIKENKVFIEFTIG